MVSTSKTEEKAAKSKSKSRAKRAPSTYNVFMKNELKKVKQENPDLNHKAAFSKAAGNWATAKENPNPNPKAPRL